MRVLTIASLCLFVAANSVTATEHVFPTPDGDRWHYPFNFTPGNRSTASTFGAFVPGFNDRDGALLVAWDTSGLISPGQGVDAYEIDSIRVVATAFANATAIPGWEIDLTVDEWFTHDVNGDDAINADGIARGTPGDTDGESDDVDPGRPIELFGLAFSENAPFDESTWFEQGIYIGSADGPETPRDPFPFVYDDVTLERLHVEDCVDGLHNEALGVFEFTPQPWAIGVPKAYTPGSQSVPFEVEFEIDLTLSGGEVLRYFQDQLNNGRILISISSLHQASVMGPTNGLPVFFTKEAAFDPAAKPVSLTVTLNDCAADGDIDDDGDVDDDDIGLFSAVAVGLNTTPAFVTASDLNCDGNVDGSDIPLMIEAYLD